MTGVVAVLLTSVPLAVLLAVALRRGNEAAIANVAASLVFTLTPATVETLLGPQVAFTPILTYWIGVASVLHCLGMLGLYESVSGWDHITHTVSAALATALFYAGFLVAGLDARGAATAALLLLLAFGVVWEAVEIVLREIGDRHDIEPILIHYGWRDTAFDLLFDVVGAVLVLTVDLRLFVPVFEALAAV